MPKRFQILHSILHMPNRFHLRFMDFTIEIGLIHRRDWITMVLKLGLEFPLDSARSLRIHWHLKAAKHRGRSC